MGVLLLVGTRKGLFLIRGDDERRSFEVEGPLLPGWSINHAVRRSARRRASTSAGTAGSTAAPCSAPAISGKTWERSEGLGLPEESELKLASTWHLEPGHASEPGTLWLGGEPAVLFRSDDSGASWQVNEGVLKHATRDKWTPGAGGLITHSIALDADDPKRLWIGISAAGVFRTEDAGASWEPANQGTEACFFPEDRYPEVGQCVHKLLAHPGGRAGSGSRTTAASTARTTTARAGSGWTATGSVRVRLRARPRPLRSGPGVRDPGGGRRESRHLRRQARDLHDRGRRGELEPDRGRRSPRGPRSSARG